MMKMEKETALIKRDEKRFAMTEPIDSSQVIVAARRMAVCAGFGKTDEMMIATAASELATNILRHAGSGEVVLSVVSDGSREGVEIVAADNGPGIEDIDLAMQDNFSTLKKSLGLGLPSVERIMDELNIDSALGSGTRVLARKWK